MICMWRILCIQKHFRVKIYLQKYFFSGHRALCIPRVMLTLRRPGPAPGPGAGTPGSRGNYRDQRTIGPWSPRRCHYRRVSQVSHVTEPRVTRCLFRTLYRDRWSLLLCHLHTCTVIKDGLNYIRNWERKIHEVETSWNTRCFILPTILLHNYSWWNINLIC